MFSDRYRKVNCINVHFYLNVWKENNINWHEWPPPQHIKIFLHNNNTGQAELEKVEKFEYFSQIDLFVGILLIYIYNSNICIFPYSPILA